MSYRREIFINRCSEYLALSKDNIIVLYIIMDTTSTLVGFSVGVFIAYLVFNTPECITKMPNTDTCSTFRKVEVPCSHSHPEANVEANAEAENNNV